MKKLLLSTLLFFAFLFLPGKVFAQGSYGQGTVLGKGTEVELEHQPVEAGLKENLAVVGGLMLVFAFAFNHKAKVERQKVKLGIF